MIHSAYKFQHCGRHPESGERAVLWQSGIGDLVQQEIYIPADSERAAELLRSVPFELNFLADEGEQSILDTYFRAATAPTGFYFRLFNDTPIETDTLADLTGEVTGTGYAAIAVARNNTDFPTLALVGGDYKITTATKTFTATGTWTAATYAVLATSSDNSGKLIAARALGATRTLVASDTLALTYSLTLS